MCVCVNSRLNESGSQDIVRSTRDVLGCGGLEYNCQEVFRPDYMDATLAPCITRNGWTIPNMPEVRGGSRVSKLIRSGQGAADSIGSAEHQLEPNRHSQTCQGLTLVGVRAASKLHV